MALKLGYLLPTRERAMVGIHETGEIIALGDRADELGIDSVWIGDSLLAKPRHDPLTMIAAIAARWGFGDIPHFTRMFRRRFGCSPGQWRVARAEAVVDAGETTVVVDNGEYGNRDYAREKRWVLKIGIAHDNTESPQSIKRRKIE